MNVFLKNVLSSIVFVTSLSMLWLSNVYSQDVSDRVTAIEVSVNGTYVAVGRHGGLFEVFDRATMQLVQSYDIPVRGFTSVAWSPIDEDVVAFADGFGAVRIMNVATGAISYDIPIVVGVADIAWSPDGSKLVGAAQHALAPPEPAVIIWDAATGNVLQELGGHNGIINSVAWSPDGTRIASSGTDSRINIWNTSTNTILHQMTVPDQVVSNVVWSPDSSRIATASYGWADDGEFESDVRIWDASSGNILATYPVEGIFDLDWSPIDELVAAADNTSTLMVLNVSNGQVLHSVQDTENISRLKWTPDGSKIVYGAGGIIKDIVSPTVNLITNITVSNSKIYERDTVAVGKTLYIDWTYTFVTVPSAYLDQEYIRTANDDKQLTTANFLTFTLTQDAWVYVMFDSRVANINLPNWLKQWIDTGETIVATEFNNTQLARRVFKKRYAAGTVVLGGNSAGSTSVMYNVIAIPDPRNETMLYRVNTGGAEVNSGNLVWSADGYYTGGVANNIGAPDVLNTADDVLYFTERSIAPTNPIVYDFPVANGTYSVRLHFAEMWFNGSHQNRPTGTGLRVFDVLIEGATVLDEYDITAEVGGPMTADVRTFSGITVSDGSLTIAFPPATVDHPTINAIEVFTVP